ncbi:hypothetical protein DQW77_07980 [Roseovarius sp. TE539]|nr:hypothetical protein DQW77_07980 [Roseovarius sp. TE539]
MDPVMNETDIFARLGLALAVGLLMGLERGWQGRTETEGGRIAGIRTFALTGLLGGISGWLTDMTSVVLPALAMLALGALLAVSYWIRLRSDKDIGLTTEIALLLTFALGVAAMLGTMAPVAAVAVVAAVLLSLKPVLHRWIAHIERFELQALFKLALISAVILPLLPDQGYGPGQVLNPYELWWAVVIVAGLSFLGYISIRLAGTRIGILATGLFGGLASSTSTTLALSRQVVAQGSLASSAAAGIVVAGSVTFLRILVLVAVFEPRLVAPLAGAMGVMAVVGLAGAALIQVLADSDPKTPKEFKDITNPLELTAALTFGGVLAVVQLAIYYLEGWFGTGGVHVAAALSGVTDVDALTISVSGLVSADIPAARGATAIFIAAAVNTAVKAGISFVAGGGRLGLRVLAVYAAVIPAGVAALMLMP